ncbi:DUF5994 family protein [Streptomyces scabichelini]|uniref:DUF5994 family protein n=1 Tax=Streptomyces scabichelini TaxID=2711217 RepID=UPI00240875A2|nr:DUF5994 family protein [Streptomyces scabichelini]
MDGAWQPRSGDLMGELPSFTDLFGSTRGRVTRVAGRLRSWRGAPLLLPGTSHMVKACRVVCGNSVNAYAAGRRTADAGIRSADTGTRSNPPS